MATSRISLGTLRLAMNKFIQIVRNGNSVANKDRAIAHIVNLEPTEKLEYIVTVEEYKESKTLEQLGYYWGVIVPITAEWQGLTKASVDKSIKTEDCADYFLKQNCCAPIYISIGGAMEPIRPSIAKMKVKQMATYIDDCINFLGINGIPVPPPTYKP
jgi:hypothetical protein